MPKVTMIWLAQYDDNTALAQYDPDTGKENLFSLVDQTRLKELSWYPVTKEIVEKVADAAINPLLNPVTLIVPKNKKVRICRRNQLDYSLASGKTLEQRIDEYVIGLEDSSLAAHIKIDGSIEISEE